VSDTYLLVGDRGEPLGMIDMGRVTDLGTALAFELAAVCDDPAAMHRVQAAMLAHVGVRTFGYVAACALRQLAEHILSPSLDVATAHGTDLRPGIRAIADGREP
jgi:hypothetical protein